MKFSKLPWYWHRLRAMSPREVTLRLQKKAHQLSDARYHSRHNLVLEAKDCFPRLPGREDAPGELLLLLQRDAKEIARGNWKAFGHMPITMDDPPRWHFDNLTGNDCRSSRVFFKVNHRAQANDSDIKVIWEPSRWYQLVRLAMAAWLLWDEEAGEKCVEWLHDWARNNPPFRGLNWTSGLETGIRLIQFTWIDSLLAGAGVPHKTLEELRRQILPPHVWYTWRYRSFGSSANNHLIGELAGLIVALVRWPELSKISAPVKSIARLWEKEVLAQFAEDGGNNEQALGYHLFSWEFCWQTQRALQAAGVTVSSSVLERISKAGRFYREVKPECDTWDFGDSDNAFVTPHFAQEANASREWWRWFNDSASSPALQFWWGDFRSVALEVTRLTSPPMPRESQSLVTSTATGKDRSAPAWKLFADSGCAVLETEDWFARFDASPLGYLSTAAHGHLDALHLSLWFRGEPVIVDPGTGAYYAEPEIRRYLADWAAHNGPHLLKTPWAFPRRLGTFLWGEPHSAPKLEVAAPNSIFAELALPYGLASRRVTYSPESNSFRIEDHFATQQEAEGVVTRWKFAPGFRVKNTGAGEFKIFSPGGSFLMKASPAWKINRSYNPPSDLANRTFTRLASLPGAPLESIVSPAFRSFTPAAYLTLEGSGGGPLEVTISR